MTFGESGRPLEQNIHFLISELIDDTDITVTKLTLAKASKQRKMENKLQCCQRLYKSNNAKCKAWMSYSQPSTTKTKTKNKTTEPPSPPPSPPSTPAHTQKDEGLGMFSLTGQLLL